jgi:DNA polymerase III gamma/tau subunit
MDHMRALVLVRASNQLPETATESVGAVLRKQAPQFSLDRLAKIAHRLIETEQQLRTGEGTPLPLELALLDLTTEATAGGPAPKQSAPQPAPTAKPEPTRPAAPARSAAQPVDLAERRAQQTAAAAQTGTATAAAATAPKGAASPAVTLERVRAAWVGLLERTQERSIGKAAQLVKAEPVAIEGGTIVLAFSDDFARNMWDRQRSDLERDLGELVGTAVRVRCVKQPAAAATNTQPATEDPMLRAALETFRRPDRILEVE